MSDGVAYTLTLVGPNDERVSEFWTVVDVNHLHILLIVVVGSALSLWWCARFSFSS